MIVKFINTTLGIALLLFIATTPVISRQPTSADETFARVAAQLDVNTPVKESAADSPTTDSAAEDEDFTDGCLIEETVYGAF